MKITFRKKGYYMVALLGLSLVNSLLRWLARKIPTVLFCLRGAPRTSLVQVRTFARTIENTLDHKAKGTFYGGAWLELEPRDGALSDNQKELFT